MRGLSFRAFVLRLGLCGVLLSAVAAAPADGDGITSSLDPEWIYVPGGLPVVTPVVAQDGKIHLLCEDRYLYRLSSDGTLDWRANLMRRPVHGAVGLDGFFVAVLETGETVGIGPAGTVVFRTGRRYETAWPPLLGFEGLIAIAYPSGHLQMRNRSGRLLWSADVVDGISAPPVAVGGVTVIGTRGGRLIGLDRYGTSLWEVWLGTEATAIAAGGGERVFVGTAEGRIMAAGLSGTTYWEVFAADAVTDLRVGPDTVVYATARGEVGRISLDGKIGQIDTLSEPPEELFFTDAGLLALEAIGRFRSLDDLLIRQLEGVPVHTAAVTAEGSVLIAAPSWEVALFDVGARPVGPWPVSGGNPHRTGRSSDFRDLDRPRSRYAQELNYLYLRDLLASPFAAEVDRALDEMLENAASSNLRGRHGYYRDLTRALLERSVQRLSRGLSTVVLPASQRRKAVELLGLLGDDESRRVLLEFSRYESETPVLSAYVRSFGLVAADPDGGLLRRTAEIVLERENPQIGAAAVAALGPLGRYDGHSGFWRSVVLRLNTGAFGDSVRSAAASLLREWNGKAQSTSN